MGKTLGRKVGTRNLPAAIEKMKIPRVIERMTCFFFEQPDPCHPNAGVVILSANQVKVGLAFIHKVLPDINILELAGDMPQTKGEQFEMLKEKVGEEMAYKLAPDFAPRLELKDIN